MAKSLLLAPGMTRWKIPEPVLEVLRRRPVQLGIAIALTTGFVLLALAGVAWRTCGFGHCPAVDRLTGYQPGRAPLLLDRNGEPIGDLAPAAGERVKLHDLPPYVPEAFLAVEDKRFYEHGALDWRRVGGALLANLRSRGLGQGSSTITMQLARNLFPQEIPGEARTTGRKLLEIRVAQDIEARFSKPEILELYLNHIYFGNGARGIEAAAQHYFHLPAARLTLAQAALLAALPKAPSHYDPRRHPRLALARRDLVLALMAAQKRVAKAAEEDARREPLGVRPVDRLAGTGQSGVARYFVDEVRHELEERFGSGLYGEPLRVWTTLDLAAQRAAEEELERQLRAVESGQLGRFTGPRTRKTRGGQAGEEDAGQVLQGAVVVLDALDGDVVAWVGGRDYSQSQFDRVAHAHRQAGSAWKPFVYAAALARGYALSQPLADQPLTVALPGGERWQPRNFDGEFSGQVSVREALAQSKNVPTVRLAQEVGYQQIADLARAAGISGPIPTVPSMPLGTLAVSPLELTSAYTAFAGLGIGTRPRLVLRVEHAGGQPLWNAPPAERRRVLDPAVAFLLNDALREALERGSGAPGREAGFQGPAAGKTGTSTGGDDVWFIGYTPRLVAGVWMGFDQPRPIANLATGGRLAAPVWGRLMRRIYAGRRAPEAWPVPPDVVARWADRETGLVVAANCPAAAERSYREFFMVGREPMAVCPGEQGEKAPQYAFFTSRQGSEALQLQPAQELAGRQDEELPNTARLEARGQERLAPQQSDEDRALAAEEQRLRDQERRLLGQRDRRAGAEESGAPAGSGANGATDASSGANETQNADDMTRAAPVSGAAGAAGAPGDETQEPAGETPGAETQRPAVPRRLPPARPPPASGRVPAAPPVEETGRPSVDQAEGAGAPGDSTAASEATAQAGGSGRDRRRGEPRQQETGGLPPGGGFDGSAARRAAGEIPEGRQGSHPESADLNGRWEIVNSIDTTTFPAFRGLRLSYRVALHQQGTSVTGEGEKWAENGRQVPAARRTPIHLSGTIAGRRVLLHFTEQGARRAVAGSFLLHVSPGGRTLSGSFSADAASTRGGSSAVRLP
jgi:1A family penicillin-binding protein